MQGMRTFPIAIALLAFAAFAPAAASAATAPIKTAPKLTPAGKVVRSDTFPVNVWLQEPLSQGEAFTRLGVGSFMGLWHGPTSDRLAAVRAAGATVMPEFSARAMRDPNAAAISAWILQDEPDNAQEKPSGGYGPCVTPAKIQAEYRRIKAADPTRPVVINFGRGVAATDWVGRGECTGHTEHYAEYAKGADVLSFDIYPVNQRVAPKLVATGVDNLRRWGGGKPVWAFVETTAYEQGNGRPTARHVRAQAWMALVHGARGISFFCHIFTPGFIEAGCLDAKQGQPGAIRTVAREIRTHARDLNARTTRAERNRRGADSMWKLRAGVRTGFAVEMDGRAGPETIRVPGVRRGWATVLGEGRRVRISGGVLRDRFAAYGVHRYRVR
ncbi:MAG: hypothetical protein JWO69_304 [Thermoleophilia bacterium]|nr:hypothetical protein [Thermoleophilia bacterium]